MLQKNWSKKKSEDDACMGNSHENVNFEVENGVVQNEDEEDPDVLFEELIEQKKAEEFEIDSALDGKEQVYEQEVPLNPKESPAI